MGALFIKEHYQTQNDICEICNSNVIVYKSNKLIPNKFYCQGSIHFTCNNQHNFFINKLYCNILDADNDIYQRYIKLK